jgi:RNA polymerase sigma-70 factor (ECF subfamily)
MIQPIHKMPEIKADSSVDLLVKAQSGDGEALDRLLTRYLPRLQRWASGRLPWGLRTMLDTGDLVQDAIIHALPHLKNIEIRSERALQFYLQRAIRHRIIDLYKRGRRHPAREEMSEQMAAGGASPQEAAIGAEAFQRYERALSGLKEEERQAIVLRFELGLEYAEIAVQLAKPSPDAARMTVTRAIVRLADKMGRPRGTAGNGTSG